MKKKILLRTYILLGIVILIGFSVIGIINYASTKSIFRQDAENVTALTSDSIKQQIDSSFNKPINISLTMANNTLLKTVLSEEQQRLNDKTFVNDMRRYLIAYKRKYNYDSIFLVSTHTNYYYHFNGIDRILKKDDPNNDWYYSFLKSNEEYSLNIDNDEAAHDEITIFINCRIKSSDGSTMGVVGVGFKIDSLQNLLKKYENQFKIKACLINTSGNIEVATDRTFMEEENLFTNASYKKYKKEILSDQNNKHAFWYSSQGNRSYTMTQYIEHLDWFLIVDNDVTTLKQQQNRQISMGIAVTVLMILLVLFMITRIIRDYNNRIVNLTVAREQEHRTIFQEATKQMYEEIHELDITHNCAASEATEHYFKSMGVPENTAYDQALEILAANQVKEEFRQGYVSTFAPANVLRAYENGTNNLSYSFMLSNDGSDYYWVRVTARIFNWEEDNSIRMFTYYQNIDSDKKQEQELLEQMQKDPLSGLYNKAATQEQIQSILSSRPDLLYAFYILDIDNFKNVNDCCGHAVGDQVICEFAQILKSQFCDVDITGRIGGDEFAVFISVPSHQYAEGKAQQLSTMLCYDFKDASTRHRVSASIGVAISPEAGKDFQTLYKNADKALYQTKEKGKNGYTIFSPNDF